MDDKYMNYYYTGSSFVNNSDKIILSQAFSLSPIPLAL